MTTTVDRGYNKSLPTTTVFFPATTETNRINSQCPVCLGKCNLWADEENEERSTCSLSYASIATVPYPFSILLLTNVVGVEVEGEVRRKTNYHNL